MITEFGKILRIIRINSGDSAREMADRLGISTSYLSAIENGKRNIPTDMEGRLTALYSLSDKDRERVKRAVAVSSDRVRIDLTELADKKKQVLFALAGEDLDEDTLDQLCQIIRNKKQ